MYIIQLNPSPAGSRPPLQAWHKDAAPDGYALCPDEFRDIFYSTSPAGFVNITVEDGVVTAMEVNQTALDAYIAAMPEEETPTDPIADLQAENATLRAQVTALTQSSQFLEDCIAEMAEQVYA